MTIRNRLLVSLFSFAFLAASFVCLPAVAAETTDAAVATDPATATAKTDATDTKASAKAEPAKTETEIKTESKADNKPGKIEYATPQGVQPSVPAAPRTVDVKDITLKPELKAAIKKDPKMMEDRIKAIQQKATAKIDLKHLPKDVTNILPFDGEAIVLAVGETKPIAAARQTKCLSKEAPSFDEALARLPASQLLNFTDGGAYERLSNRCGGNVPARLILATGTVAGTEKLNILGATVTVIVQ